MFSVLIVIINSLIETTKNLNVFETVFYGLNAESGGAIYFFNLEANGSIYRTAFQYCFANMQGGSIYAVCMCINFNCIEGDMCCVKRFFPESGHFSYLQLMGRNDWNNSIITKCSLDYTKYAKANIIYTTAPTLFSDGNITNCHNGDSEPGGICIRTENNSKIISSHFSNISSKQAILLFSGSYSSENRTVVQTILHNISCSEAAIRATLVSCIVDKCTFINNLIDAQCDLESKLYIINSQTTSQKFYSEKASDTVAPHIENCETNIKTPEITSRMNCLAENSEVPKKRGSRIKIYAVQLIL